MKRMWKSAVVALMAISMVIGFSACTAEEVAELLNEYSDEINDIVDSLDEDTKEQIEDAVDNLTGTTDDESGDDDGSEETEDSEDTETETDAESGDTGSTEADTDDDSDYYMTMSEEEWDGFAIAYAFADATKSDDDSDYYYDEENVIKLSSAEFSRDYSTWTIDTSGEITVSVTKDYSETVTFYSTYIVAISSGSKATITPIKKIDVDAGSCMLYRGVADIDATVDGVKKHINLSSYFYASDYPHYYYDSDYPTTLTIDGVSHTASDGFDITDAKTGQSILSEQAVPAGLYYEYMIAASIWERIF